MNSRRLTFRIGEREALPVRAIPYVTGWDQFSPDVVAQYLGQHERFSQWFLPLEAYHLSDDTPVKVQPREWDAVVATLEGYEAELKQQYPDDAIGYAAWRKNAAGKLPAGVFVWLDEFEQVYRVKRERVIYMEPKRVGDDDLILAPMLDEAARAMVLEGYDRMAQGEQADPMARSKRAATKTHRLQTRSDGLAAVIELAIGAAVAPGDCQSVWAELVKLAESKNRPAPLLGYSSDGIQYRGKKYEETGEPDAFKAKNLSDRMRRANAR